ncbi:MAG TPA: flavodoxin family protein [Clostridiales bacterium]|nr:flavodoxin family protein [Clostridiales bacterium]
MKVVAFNGSPRKGGNTEQCLKMIEKELSAQGIEMEIIQVGNQVKGCMACYHCLNTGSGHCVQKDAVNEWIDKMVEADGIILASPVYYGGISGGMKCFLDRAFLSAGNKLHHKVGAAFVTLRRSGGLETYQQLNAYMNTMEMVIATSDYWQAIHGLDKGEIMQDTEGVEVIQKLGRNMAWLMRVIDAAKGKIDPPQTGQRTMTNFVR